MKKKSYHSITFHIFLISTEQAQVKASEMAQAHSTPEEWANMKDSDIEEDEDRGKDEDIDDVDLVSRIARIFQDPDKSREIFQAMARALASGDS